ncbi:response regulator transcription factor [Kribbella kalugense]|uniref:LuxR family two component transcriptional regulator n=1 Tax=Kribbella kalugense TaxID=2512221 RepID=A0A4R7ZQ25_9ACTN|nr:response regulator transcription factor [Kribbella kalugense]TDW18668.1 LuxR family two component transcriptional regulator [Kribbella kalugense]
MIRVLLADDMKLFRAALKNLLEKHDDFEVVAEVYCGDQIVPIALELRPDVAVIDIEMPGQDGLAAAAALRVQLPSCRTLILTAFGSPANLRRALSSQAGGFLSKDVSPEALAEAIRQVAAGIRVVDPKVAAAALTLPPNPLTPREVEVLRLAAGGAEAKQIAVDLFLSTATVRNYLSSIAAKLNARTQVDAVRIATDAGWI